MDTQVKAGKLRKYERILQAVDKCISSRDDQYERNKGILQEILEDVFTTMKGRDSFLQAQYRGFFFIENYHNRLQVGKTEEFEVNIIIKIPLDYSYITLLKGEPGHQKLGLLKRSRDRWSNLSSWLMERTSGDYVYIDKGRFRRGLEGLLARAMLNIPKIDNYTVNVRKANHPFTLSVNKQGFPEMNVSLMPIVEFSGTPPYTIPEKFEWYALPEILQNVADEHVQWRMAFYKHEDDLLKRHAYMESVIRQIEKLRDNQEWKVIPRYHIKTLCMRYALNVDRSPSSDTWKLTGIKLFIHILDELKKACTSRDLKSCWDSGHNLVNADKSQLEVITEQMTVTIREIINDPAKLADWLLTPEELDMYQNEMNATGNVEDIDDLSESQSRSKESEPGSSEDILDTADEVSKLGPGATAVSGGIESPPSNEADKDVAVCPEKMDLLGVIAGLKDTVEMQSRLLTALAQILATMIRSNVQKPPDLAPSDLHSLFNTQN